MSDALRTDYSPYDEKTGRCRLCRHPAHPRFFTHKTAADFAAENKKSFQTWTSRQNVWLEQQGGGETAWQKLKEEANAGKPMYIVRDRVAYRFNAIPPTLGYEGRMWDGCTLSVWAIDRLVVGPAFEKAEHTAMRKARRAALKEGVTQKRR
jgi:hypothetical protein